MSRNHAYGAPTAGLAYERERPPTPLRTRGPPAYSLLKAVTKISCNPSPNLPVFAAAPSTEIRATKSLSSTYETQTSEALPLPNAALPGAARWLWHAKDA